MLRYYWPKAKWVRESYFQSEAHWRNQTGYFQKNGYFHKNKRHQTRLPGWAMEKPGIKIRRAGGSSLEEKSVFEKVEGYFKRVSPMVVDTRTGEIVKMKGSKKNQDEKTYLERLEACGKKTWMKLVTKKETIKGVFKIPYKKIREEFEGVYEEGLGYVFRVTGDQLKEFLGAGERCEFFERAPEGVWHRERLGFLKWGWCLRPAAVIQGR